MDNPSLLASLLAAVAVLLILYSLVRVARWARARTTGGYGLGAAGARVSAGGSGLVITCAALGLLYSVMRFAHDEGVQGSGFGVQDTEGVEATAEAENGVSAGA